MGLTKHICVNCGSSFENYFKEAKYCSKECYKNYRSKNRLIKICKNCNKEFIPHDSNTVYCCKKCASEAMRNRIECICDNCGKIFFKQYNQYVISNKHFCSDICRKEYRCWSNEELEILRNNYNSLSKDEIYLLLNKNRSKSEIKRKAVELNLTTNDKWSDDEIDILLNNYENIPIDDVVKLLPKRTRVSVLSQARKFGLISLTNKLKTYNEQDDKFLKDNYEHMTNIQLAEHLKRTPNAISQRLCKMGLYREKQKTCYESLSNYIRKNLTYWKDDVRKSSNYTCQISGSHSNLVIHHIYGFNLLVNDTIEYLNFDIKDSMDKYNKDELKLFLDTFLQIQNKRNSYICISDKVHKDFHNKYGYGNNTEEQWNEYINLYKNKK